MLASLNAPGITKIKCVNSRDHTERLFKYLKIPLKINKISKKQQVIEVEGKKQYNVLITIYLEILVLLLFIVLTLYLKNSKNYYKKC